ncbi:MAG: hypothetical protein N2V78_09280 [Methanophagales archaeon]|nr:hypothetical protein [Methanophagales archaeon]
MSLIYKLDELIAMAEESNLHVKCIELDIGTFCQLAIEVGADQKEMGTIEKYRGIPVHSVGYDKHIKLVFEKVE